MIHLLPLLAPALFLGAMAMIHLRRDMGAQSTALLGEGAAALALLVAMWSLGVLLVFGPGDSVLLGFAGIGLSARVDVVSVVMLLLVTFIGWVVVRYARTYLDGEAGQGRFTFWLLATLAAVLLLVLAGNVIQFVGAWITTSLCLHKLLLFYPGRAAAQRAAFKKFVTARAGDAALIGAVALLIATYDTTQITQMLAAARLGEGGALAIGAAALLALAAVPKSAQFPTHGWLTEVMEAPTPVSALLHAGVVNGGGFLLIRFADVMLLSPLVLAVLVGIGGFTALFGGVVMLTQPSVKVSLAWSTVSQMGFMILQCGLALFPLALLHIVAHSLYKAHAFLSAGGAVARVAAIRRPGPIAVPSLGAVARAFGLAIAIYGGVYLASGMLVGFGNKSPQAVALGVILILGVGYLLAQGLADAAPRALTRRTGVLSVAAALSYFALQRGSEWLTAGTLPAAPVAGPLEWALILLALCSFGAVALAQSTLPLWSHHPAAQGLRVHLSNGFYINAIEDRLLNIWSRNTSKTGAKP
ncbi:proton-conducting transporter transmembrane domain-containing protein [Pseudosulfitobacter koreensis]|uniref:Probable inorganic carbon transporter subunit DabB n=1 Tax=Pseudosulfitobacter koreensis TaxID=2968472 RepID=A0ABT1Z429_9RHOB|nr:proton-conducting transporter membrane subunit [Pseudosulfitobacter koreense]MCR8827897.1 NADH-quinone oxidoreductase subunit L [Pseudosulfitobacter koreense]